MDGLHSRVRIAYLLSNHEQKVYTDVPNLCSLLLYSYYIDQTIVQQLPEKLYCGLALPGFFYQGRTKILYKKSEQQYNISDYVSYDIKAPDFIFTWSSLIFPIISRN